MCKRIMFTLAFVATLSAVGTCLTQKADARWYVMGRPYTSAYYAPRSYAYGVPYRSYSSSYNGYYGSRPYYSSYYGDPGYYYYRPVPRVAVQVGPYWR